MKKTWFYILVFLLLSVPTFSLMLSLNNGLRPGIFSMQDFHIFRLIEFDKCIKVLQIPCRWAPDSGAGYGEPLFNFYGQFSYWIGEIFHLISFSIVDSIKLLFILSFTLSGIGMFFLGRKIWQNDLSALVSSVIYLYAPYRAVDVWVRGALPEAISFVFFPLIILSIENYLETSKKKHLLLFSLLIALLIINHNLSIILFAPFLIIWITFRFIQTKNVKPFLELVAAGLFSGFLSAFYLLPVIFESKFVNINSTTLGVYDWRANFVTVYQLFISRFWGYGGSTWGPNDGLSLSVGQMQWIIPAVIIAIILIKRKINNDTLIFLVLVLIGSFALFLTHNKSTFIWNLLPFMKYIQFPWRFLGTATFALALASGLIIKEVSKFKWLFVIGIIGVAISINFNFFRPDIWYKISDKDFLNGPRWDEERFSSLPDYWPNFGPLPNKLAPTETKDIKLISKNSNEQDFIIKTFDKDIELPVVYFPGWQVTFRSNGKTTPATYDKNGLIVINVPKANNSIVEIDFKDTFVRTLGNRISEISLIGYVFFIALLLW